MQSWINTVATFTVNGQIVEKQQGTMANGETYTQFVSDIDTKPRGRQAINGWYKNIRTAIKNDGYEHVGTMGIGYSAWPRS
jgi:hypothetical protein